MQNHAALRLMRKCRVWQLALPSPLLTIFFYNFHPPQHHFGRAHRSYSDADDDRALKSLSDVTALLVEILRRLYGCWCFWTELHVGRLLVTCTVCWETRLLSTWTCWWARAHPSTTRWI